MDYKKTEMDYDDLPFKDFLTSRYSMTVRINAQKTHDVAKENNVSFFNLTLACMLEAINEIREFRLRIIGRQVVEYEKITGVCPIMQDDYSIREIEVLPVSEFDDFFKWNEYVENKKENILENQFLVEPMERDSKGIANFSCIPWLNFDSMTNIIAESNQIMPVVAWGKLTDGKIPVSLTASHVFIFGYHFKLFYDALEKYLENPEMIINCTF